MAGGRVRQRVEVPHVSNLRMNRPAGDGDRAPGRATRMRNFDHGYGRLGAMRKPDGAKHKANRLRPVAARQILVVPRSLTSEVNPGTRPDGRWPGFCASGQNPPHSGCNSTTPAAPAARVPRRSLALRGVYLRRRWHRPVLLLCGLLAHAEHGCDLRPTPAPALRSARPPSVPHPQVCPQRWPSNSRLTRYDAC